jgi:hypothetical protein
MEGGGVGAVVGAVVAAHGLEQLEEAALGNAGMAAADGHGGEQWPVGGQVLLDDLLQQLGDALDAAGTGDLGELAEVAVGHRRVLAGHRRQHAPELVPFRFVVMHSARLHPVRRCG